MGTSSFAVPDACGPFKGFPGGSMMLLGYQPPHWALLPSWGRGIPFHSVAVSQDGVPETG